MTALSPSPTLPVIAQKQTASASSDAFLFMLRHLGPQTERDLAESLAPMSIADVRAGLESLRAAGRIEHTASGWRIIPSRAGSAPTNNPGTR